MRTSDADITYAIALMPRLHASTCTGLVHHLFTVYLFYYLSYLLVPVSIIMSSTRPPVACWRYGHYIAQYNDIILQYITLQYTRYGRDHLGVLEIRPLIGNTIVLMPRLRTSTYRWLVCSLVYSIYCVFIL